MSTSDVVIRVEGLGKKYALHHEQGERYTALRDVVARQAKAAGRLLNPFTLAGQLRKAQRQAAQEQASSEEEFWALKDVSFEIRRGERVGIIGRNGAGKSTLLKILSRITEPTTGRVEIRGRVASLLEVGTGFHPELTGRENIYLNGAILGMTRREIRAKFDEIVDFAEVKKFLDTPVKRYSSGMYVRLAFAVAAHLEPEILVVDEVLAVGDATFQKKCLDKLNEKDAGEDKTVLFVSHMMSAIKSLCSKGIVINNGRIALTGNTEDCISYYLSTSIQSDRKHRWTDLDEAPRGEKVRLKGIQAIMISETGENAHIADLAKPIDIVINVVAEERVMFHTTLHFVSDQGVTAFTSGGIPPRDANQETEQGEYELKCHVPSHLLNEGSYEITIFIIERGNKATLIINNIIGIDVRDISEKPVGSYHGREPGVVRPKLQWSASKL